VSACVPHKPRNIEGSRGRRQKGKVKGRDWKTSEPNPPFSCYDKEQAIEAMRGRSMCKLTLLINHSFTVSLSLVEQYIASLLVHFHLHYLLESIVQDPFFPLWLLVGAKA
jgi:hypothetical protein